MVQNVATRRWTVDELRRLRGAGVLARDERLELLEGELVPIVTQGPEHAWSITLATHALVAAFGRTHFVRAQLPIELSPRSEPEPDFAIVPRHAGVDTQRHKLPVDLVVEVSLTSLRYDREEKGSLYARAGVPEYWIVNVRARVLERFLDPVPDPSAPYGSSYATRSEFSERESVKAVFLEGPAIEVSDLFVPQDTARSQSQ